MNKTTLSPRDARVIELRESGLTLKVIAARMGCSITLAGEIVRRNAYRAEGRESVNPKHPRNR